jgi:hypothetical protein
VVGGLGTLAGIGAKIYEAIKASVPPASETFSLIVTAPVGVWLAAVIGGVITFIVVAVFYYKRCHEDPDRQQQCSSGVINECVPSFDSGWDQAFPFIAMHDRVDVVVKSRYWSVAETNALYVKCASDGCESPIIQAFYESEEVCAAGLGSTIGGGAGLVGGIIAGAAIGAAIGCATVILCIFALLAAFVVAVAAVLIGALAGGQIGKAVAGDSEPTAEGGTAIDLGHYVTTEGGLVTHGDLDGARVYWFVERTVLHGRSTGSPQFSYVDPDRNLPRDACERIVE